MQNNFVKIRRHLTEQESQKRTWHFRRRQVCCSCVRHTTASACDTLFTAKQQQTVNG